MCVQDMCTDSLPIAAAAAGNALKPLVYALMAFTSVWWLTLVVKRHADEAAFCESAVCACTYARQSLTALSNVKLRNSK